ncbi:unnamed protein product [Heterobilharzia americana]|nr:unnamed protein product [Heterobilharzia americana]
MHKTDLMEITVIILIKITSAEHQDHVILWDASNWRFKGNRNQIYVNEGDNLIFICPSNRTFSQNLYWTDDHRVQLKCQETLQIKVVKLLDCFDNKSVKEFVLKVSQFPEIVSLPIFRHNSPIHFVAQSVICQQNNFRLSATLASDNTTYSSSAITDPSSSPSLKLNNELNRASSYNFTKGNINFPPNSSSQYPNTDLYKPDGTDWKEYRFLLLPAILALFTLIGMQIVLCSFWLPNSIVDILLKCFSQCQHFTKHKTPTDLEAMHLKQKFRSKIMKISHVKQ